MGLFYLFNCLALATGPYVLLYKSSGIRENDGLSKCINVAVVYCLSQLLKMFLTTLMPQNIVLPLVLKQILYDALGAGVDLIASFYFFLRMMGRQESAVTIVTMGWAVSELILTKYVPIWSGTRELEFNWFFLQLSFEANLDLIFYFSSFQLTWLMLRREASAVYLPTSIFLIGAVSLRQTLFRFADSLLARPAALILFKTGLAFFIGAITLLLRAVWRSDGKKLEAYESISIIDRIKALTGVALQKGTLYSSGQTRRSKH